MSNLKVSPKKVVLCGISFLAALMAMLALSFPLARDSGFSLLSSIGLIFDYGEALDIIEVLLALLQMIASLALLILSWLGAFCFSDNTSETISMVSVIASVAFNGVYMIEGIVSAIVYGVFTFSFFPLIISIPITVSFFVFKSKFKEAPVPQSALNEVFPVATKAESEDTSETISSDKVNIAMMNFKNFIPEERMPAFREALSRASEQKYTHICMLPLKNPTTVLLFSIFLGGFGVDRFYIGDTGVGVAKLLLGWLTFGIWPFVDIFMCYKKAKENNLQALMGNLK